MLLVILTGGIDLSVGLGGGLRRIAGDRACRRRCRLPGGDRAWRSPMGLAVGYDQRHPGRALRLQAVHRRRSPRWGACAALLYIYSETPHYPEDPLFRSLLGGGFIGPFPVPTSSS